MRLWKWVGLAGVLGAAGVGGAVVVHRRRQRVWNDDVDPDELRERLHDRLADARRASAVTAAVRDGPT